MRGLGVLNLPASLSAGVAYTSSRFTLSAPGVIRPVPCHRACWCNNPVDSSGTVKYGHELPATKGKATRSSTLCGWIICRRLPGISRLASDFLLYCPINPWRDSSLLRFILSYSFAQNHFHFSVPQDRDGRKVGAVAVLSLFFVSYSCSLVVWEHNHTMMASISTEQPLKVSVLINQAEKQPLHIPLEYLLLSNKT